METKLKAKEILDYCIDYLVLIDIKPKIYKEMLKEIKFMLETN